LNVSCKEPNNCDYEGDNFCGWDNDKKTDQFDWEITKGPSSETLATGKKKTNRNSRKMILIFRFLYRSIY